MHHAVINRGHDPGQNSSERSRRARRKSEASRGDGVRQARAVRVASRGGGARRAREMERGEPGRRSEASRGGGARRAGEEECADDARAERAERADDASAERGEHCYGCSGMRRESESTKLVERALDLRAFSICKGEAGNHMR